MTTSQHHMDHFNRIILELFVRLFDAFPHPQNIDSQTAVDIGFGDIENTSTDKDTMNLGAKANDVMEWLREEGFIRYDPDPNYRPGNFWKVRLTLKTVTILGYVPVSFRKTDPKESLIQKAKHVMTATDSLSGKEAMKRVVEEIFKRAVSQRLS